jgi:hypothetical protein
VPANGGDAYAGGYCGLIMVVLIVATILAVGALVFVAITLVVHSTKHGDGRELYASTLMLHSLIAGR